VNETNTITDAFKQQSDWCARLGSPFTALLMDVLADHLDDRTRTGRRILSWGQLPMRCAMPYPCAWQVRYMRPCGLGAHQSWPSSFRLIRCLRPGLWQNGLAERFISLMMR
jgi:hypothetical protein